MSHDLDDRVPINDDDAGDRDDQETAPLDLAESATAHLASPAELGETRVLQIARHQEAITKLQEGQHEKALEAPRWQEQKGQLE